MTPEISRRECAIRSVYYGEVQRPGRKPHSPGTYAPKSEGCRVLIIAALRVAPLCTRTLAERVHRKDGPVLTELAAMEADGFVTQEFRRGARIWRLADEVAA